MATQKTIRWVRKPQQGRSRATLDRLLDATEALLDAVYERHQQQAVLTIEQLMDPSRWKDVSLERVLEELVRFVVRLYRERTGLMRTLVLRGHARPDRRYRDPAQRNRLAIAGVGKLFAARRSEVGHPNPSLAGSLGLLMVLGAAREKILFSESTSRAITLSDAQLIRELTRAFVGYAQVHSRRERR